MLRRIFNLFGFHLLTTSEFQRIQQHLDAAEESRKRMLNFKQIASVMGIR